MTAKKNEGHYTRFLHEVIDIVDTLCELQLTSKFAAIPYIVGTPGGGKTESIRALAEKNDDEYISCHFALKQQEDLGGIPQFTNIVVNGEKQLATIWSFPDFIADLVCRSNIAITKEIGGVFITNKLTKKIRIGIPKEDAANFTGKNKKAEKLCELYNIDDNLDIVVPVKGDNKKRRVILLLDDMHRCGAYHNSALFEILTERKIHGYKFPDNMVMILAGNNSQKAGAQAMLSAIVNRIAILPVSTSFDFWKYNFALPNRIHTAVISFLSNDRYSASFHAEEQVDKSWASPRSWTNFANALSLYESKIGSQSKSGRKIVPLDMVGYLASGHLGDVIAGNFISFYKIFTEFETDEIFNTVKEKKDFFKYIQKYDSFQQYALAYACIDKYLSVPQEKRMKIKLYEVITNIIMAYDDKESGSSYPEIGMSILKELQLTLKATGATKEYHQIMSIMGTAQTGSDGKSAFTQMIEGIFEYHR